MMKKILITLIAVAGFGLSAYGQGSIKMTTDGNRAQYVYSVNADGTINSGGGGGGGGDFTIAAYNAAFGTAGSPDSQVLSVQGIASGTALPVSVASLPSHAVTNTGTFAVQAAEAQKTGVPSNFAVATADGTVFTLAAGEIGFIQNLDSADALAVKYGASASTSSFSFILPSGSAADDGQGGSVRITNWVGAVSVATMTGTARYIAWKVAP